MRSLYPELPELTPFKQPPVHADDRRLRLFVHQGSRMRTQTLRPTRNETQ